MINTSIVVLAVLFALSVTCIIKTIIKIVKLKREYYKDVDKE